MQRPAARVAMQPLDGVPAQIALPRKAPMLASRRNKAALDPGRNVGKVGKRRRLVQTRFPVEFVTKAIERHIAG